jgi:hypothetical protein
MALRFTRLALGAAAFALGAATFPAAAQDPGSVQRYCSHKTDRAYGYACQGFAQVNPAVGLEPVTLVGVVRGSPTGIFDGHATFSASIGSVRQHLNGQAIFQDRTCFGHIQYRVWILLPNGTDGPELPPLDIDFTTVDGGEQIFGAPNNFAGTGAAVPRLVCKLHDVKH